MNIQVSRTDPQQSAFLKACRRQETPFVPVWLMRQAGRYMREYRAVRERHDFLELCKDPALCAEVAVTAQRKLGVDAAILFSDILLIVESFGLGLSYEKGGGPRIARPIRTADDVRRLREPAPERTLAYVMDAVRLTRKELAGRVPLIGFAGAPFTLASYMIEGGGTKDFTRTRAFARSQPKAWHQLLEKIGSATARYLNAQIKAGAQAVQLFDSWAGALSPAEYERLALPYSRGVFGALGDRVPTIHFGTGTGKFLKRFAAAGSSVVGVDSRVSLRTARRTLGGRQALQGNLDPQLLATKGPKEIEKAVKKILSQAGSAPGFIFNLGHGVLPATPVENAIALVEAVHRWSRR